MDTIITTPIELNRTEDELKNIVYNEIHAQDSITGEPNSYSITFRIDDLKKRLETKIPSLEAKKKGEENIQKFVNLLNLKFEQNKPKITIPENSDINCHVSIVFS